MEPLSPRNPRVQAVRRLARQARERADRRAFVVEGPVLVQEAIAAPCDVEQIFYGPAADPAMLESWSDRGLDLVAVTDASVESMSTTVTPQPVVAVVRRPESARLPTGSASAHVLVLDAVQDPGNAGTILRSAESSGASLVVFGAGSVDAYSPKVVRSSAGSLFRVPVRADASSAADVIAALVASGLEAWGTAADAAGVYDEVDLTKAVLVLGNEAHGMSAATRAALTGEIRIPQVGAGESLNVAMAATILCFEAARQRRASP